MTSARADAPANAGRAGAIECPLCGGEAAEAFTASDLNRATTGQRFDYAVCRVCGTYFLLAAPPDMAPHYPQEYYTLPAAEELDALARAEPFGIGLVLDHTTPGRLVEIGPGEGVFARAARNAGFEVTVIEMDPRACQHLRTVAEVEVINSAAPEEALVELPPSRAIVMWHVIEHLRRPWDVLERAAANLEPGGVLVIATPNPRSLQFRLLGRRWAHLDAPRHLFLIPPSTLAGRCRELGLSLEHTTSADPAGLHWNRFGWEYALRRAPRSRPGARASRTVSALIARALRPIETRGENGCAYTSVFVKTSAA
jgi:SAM-dependent methyltransferase